MEKLRDSALLVGLAMGVFFAVVGFTAGNVGLVGLGAVVALAGYFSKPKSD
jgi:hypothetical protein